LQLFESYVNSYDVLSSWSDALLGIAGSGFATERSGYVARSMARRVHLLRLVQPVAAAMFEHLHLLLGRCRVVIGAGYDSAVVRMTSSFLKVLLHESDDAASLLVGVAISETANNQGMGSGGGSGAFSSAMTAALLTVDDVTASSRKDAGQQQLPLVSLVGQWIDDVLFSALRSAHSVEDTVAICRDIIQLTQHHILMGGVRTQVNKHFGFLNGNCCFCFY
jgi:hypothetical protein